MTAINGWCRPSLIRSWVGKLAKHKPGDVVNVGVKRDGEEITLEVTLQGR